MSVKDYFKKIKSIDKSGFFDAIHSIESVFESGAKAALDIGGSSIKLLELEHTRHGMSLAKLAYKEIPQLMGLTGAEADGSKAGIIAEALQNLCAGQKIGPTRVKLVLSDPDIYLRHIRIPKVEEQEIQKAIKWQIEKYAPFNIDEAIVDFQTLDSSIQDAEGQMEIVAVAAKRQTIDMYLSILKNVRFTPLIIDVCAFSAAKAFWHNYTTADSQDMAAIVDIGSNTTSITIVKGNSLEFARNIEIAGSHFTQAVAKERGIEMEEAERIKIQDGISCVPEPLLKDLVKAVDRSFAYCETELLLERISKVILCGRGAQLKGLDKFFQDKLGVSCEMADVFKNIKVDLNKFDETWLKDIAPGLMAVIGAAV